MVSDAEVFASLRHARKVLQQQGHACHTSAREFVRWLQTETPYPNPTFDEIVNNPFLVVHELVEIEEVKRMGLRMAKDVIVRNPLPIAVAHLRAAEVEFRVAYNLGDINHLKERVEAAKTWCEDSVVTPALKRRHEAFRDRWVQLLFQSTYDDMVGDWIFE